MPNDAQRWSNEAQHRERLAQEEQLHESAEARLMGLLDEARQERQTVEKAPANANSSHAWMHCRSSSRRRAALLPRRKSAIGKASAQSCRRAGRDSPARTGSTAGAGRRAEVPARRTGTAPTRARGSAQPLAVANASTRR
ncbi:hypothetical protein DSL92_00175 [Billgrantia gudaonensis]|uniref:Uncharacterized protein n=1 Tax=Billgrantia gudaonensis TaxID=376427 RepID=A0A3S0Q1Q0_9GAMM|nr:hypothetical protein DSL92_00175 [Halomonas gudaonensis]